jgi:hypothetical protein
MVMKYRYYTISYGDIERYVGITLYCTPISTKPYADTVRCRMQYRDLRCDVRFCLPGTVFAAWSASRSCLIILGPPGWSVLHCHSPDALYLVLAYYTATNVSGDSVVLAK